MIFNTRLWEALPHSGPDPLIRLEHAVSNIMANGIDVCGRRVENNSIPWRSDCEMASNTRHITIHAPAAFRRLPNGVFWDPFG